MVAANPGRAAVGASDCDYRCVWPLGRTLLDACETRGLACVGLSRRELDISEPEAVRAAISRWQPWAIVNAAGYLRVDAAEQDRTACRRASAVGPAVLALVCRQRGIQLASFSSDLVFDGAMHRPYVKSDPVNPLNVYGRTKAEGSAAPSRSRPPRSSFAPAKCHP